MDRELNIDIDTNAWNNNEELVLDLSPSEMRRMLSANQQMQGIGNNNFTSSGSNVPPSIIQPKQHDHGFPHMVTASSFNNNFQSEFQTEGTPSIPLMQYSYGAPKLGTCLSFNNYSSQSEKSGVPAKTPTSDTNYYWQDAETIKRLRKREADKRHNEKKKGQIQKTEQKLSFLEIENELLKDENGCLKNENEAMKVSLGSSNAETKLLTTEVCKLNKIVKLQAVTVATLSDKVVDDNHEEELADLKRSVEVMSKKIKREEWMIENETLRKTVATLERELKIAKVQNEVLCLRYIANSATEIGSELR